MTLLCDSILYRILESLVLNVWIRQTSIQAIVVCMWFSSFYFITHYCYSDEERLRSIEELGPDPEITRFKGLGEISPEEFVKFIGPDMRLEQVTLHKTDQVQKLLEYYMGKNTPQRQDFIINNLVVEEDRPEEEYYD